MIRRICAAALALVVLVPAGCTKLPQERALQNQCATAVVSGPVGTYDFDEGRPRVEAVTISRCDTEVYTHRVTLTFQRAVGGDRWETVGSGETCDKRPVPGWPVECRHRLPGDCVEGDWRVRVFVSGSAPASHTNPTPRDFTFTYPDQPSDLVACPRLRPE